MRARPALVLLAEALSEGSDEALVLVDRRRNPHLVCEGQPVPARLGRTREEILADPLALVHPTDVEDVRRAFLATADMPGSMSRVEFRALHADGHWTPMVATIANHYERADLGALVLRLAFPSTDDEPPSGPSEASPSWRAAGMATHNDLSLALDHTLDAHRKGEPGFTLLMIELKDFRRVRNSFPAAEIEQLAFRIAERCEPLLAERDVFAHVGAGTFGILMRSVDAERQATRAANRFARALERPFEVGGTPMKLAPLVGFATTTRRYDDAESMLRDASTAIGRAERGRGRRRVAAFQTQFRSEERDRLMLVADMSKGLENDEFHLAYQPIIDLRDGNLLGFEALCRWKHPARGPISPGAFIPLAEETGMIEVLGEWVLRTACRQMALWRRRHPAVARLTMSVNVSSAQLANSDDLLAIVEDAMRKSDLPPEQLRLELTESMVLEDVEAAAAAVARLRLYGVTFSLDDFGTGYSSLGLLHRLDYEVLKIDRSFVAGDWGTNRKIITAIIDMAHGLGMKVVAEGVETTAQAAALAGLDCDAAQGFLYSTPLSVEAATRLLASGKRFEV